MSRTQLLNQLLLLTALLEDDQERELSLLGLTKRRTHVLWLVHERGPLIQRDLAAAMEITPRHVTTLVDELIDAGLAARGAHPTDRRAVLVSLTATGSALMERMADDHVGLAEALTAGWTSSEVDALGAQIETIVSRLQSLIAEAAAGRETGAAA